MRTRDIVLIVLGVAVLILVIGVPLFGGMMWGGGMMGHWGQTGGPSGWSFGLWGIAMMIAMVLFWALIIAGIVLLVMWLVRAAGVPAGAAQPPAREDPLDILKQRYARGEITGEQYEQMRQDLNR